MVFPVYLNKLSFQKQGINKIKSHAVCERAKSDHIAHTFKIHWYILSIGMYPRFAISENSFNYVAEIH